MTLPFIWQVVAASLLATALLAAIGVLLLARRVAALCRTRETVEQRLTHLTFELRRLERLVAEVNRRGAAPSPSLGSNPLAPLITIPDLAREGGPGDAAGLAERHDEVWSLVQAGRTPREIADATGRPIGEVELIAGLHRQHLAVRARGRHVDA